MRGTMIVTLPSGEDVRLEQDGNFVTIWRWADPAPFTDKAAWIVAGELLLDEDTDG